MTLSFIDVLRMYQEALNILQWKVVMDTEMSTLHSHGTWVLVPSTSAQKDIVGCRWVFVVKYLANGHVDQYKVRLVAKGFT